MRCSKCGADNREGARFCDKCGAKLSPRCALCGAENRTDAKFCDSCGAAFGADATVAAPAAKINDTPIRVTETSAAENLEGERKTVTALFADIKGSMELIEDLDPEEARAIVDPALKLMIEAVQHYGGYVAQSTGDGVFALFGAPIAHEDHPQRALFAALRMQAEVKRYAEKLRADKGVNLQVRVGANTGEVVVREIRTGEKHAEYLPIGHSTSVAARLQALAAPGSIAISEPVRKLVEGYFALKSVGPARIKGASGPLEIYEVTGLGPLRTRLQRSASRGYTKFVGREHEMEAMQQALELAKQGQGQVIAVIGAPGVGKSRLVSEFKARAKSECLVLEASPFPYGKASAWLPVIDLLKSYFRISDDDDPRTRREKVGAKVVMLERSLEDALAPPLALLGIAATSQKFDDGHGFGDGEGAGRRLVVLNTVRRLLLCESLNQPLVLIFEDLHWIDGETQALLDALVESLASARILLLVNYRPEYRHEWGNKSYYTQVRLDPLRRESADEMLGAILGEGKDLVPLKRLIIDKTEGNPFFIEEIVQALFEEGALVRNGEVKAARSLSGIQIPATVQPILAARIDRLPSDQKDLLQTLAVLGKEFPVRLVSKVTDKSDDELNRMLANLQSAEFIYEQPTMGDVEYAFKHALTQEVAYGSMLVERRKTLHERAGDAIETIFRNRLEDQYSELARHYGRSANREKAFNYARLAGKTALARYAYEEAIGHLGTALELLGQHQSERPRDELEIRLQLGEALGITGGWGTPETGASYSRARELCAVTDAPAATTFEALEGTAISLLDQGKRRLAREAAEELLGVAERSGDAALIGRARSRVGWMLNFIEPSKARPYLEQALSSEAELPRSSTALIRTNLAFCLLRLGYLDQARSRMRQAEQALAQGGTEPWHLAVCHNNAASFYAQLGDGGASLRHADAAESLAEKYGLSEFASRSRGYRAHAVALIGRREEALSLVRACADSPPSTSYRLRISELQWLGLTCAEVRLFEDGLGILETLQSIVEGSGGGLTPVSHFVDSLKGRLLLRCDPPDLKTAEDCLRRSIQPLRARGEKFSELRCATDLALVLRDTGHRDEACALLAEIYDWFTEGLDTRYLKEAKALLEELSNSPR
jgi:class 3 adenylate cyclase/tetratricopeptide (TPR) repeat protein